MNRRNGWSNGRCQALRDPWAFEEHDRPRQASVALLPGVNQARGDRSMAIRLSARSAIGRYPRSRRTWDLDADLTGDDAERMIAVSIRESVREPEWLVAILPSTVGIHMARFPRKIPGPRLRLVHRGLRHCRPKGGEGAVGRAEIGGVIGAALRTAMGQFLPYPGSRVHVCLNPQTGESV